MGGIFDDGRGEPVIDLGAAAGSSATRGIVREDGIFVTDASVTELPHEALH